MGRNCTIVVALLATLAVAAAAQNQDDSITCPFEYDRHSLTSILAGTVRPWLYVSGLQSRRDGEGGF
jgi:hypothetical protein